MATWKAVERAIARLLGGRRVPVSGRQRGDAPDIEHPFFSLEVKHRESLPDWILDAMRQATASKHGDQVPMVILHQKNMKYDESLAIMEIRDIMKLQEQIAELRSYMMQNIKTKLEAK
jgi:hypothetical protein